MSLDQEEELKKKQEEEKKESEKRVKELLQLIKEGKNKITYLQYDLYIIETFTGKYVCPYCKIFKETKSDIEILNTIKLLKLNSNEFKYQEIKIDWMDRLFTSKNDSKYSDYSLSDRGKNWYYALGNFVNGFPTIDFWVKIVNSKGTEKVCVRRFESLGVTDPNTNEIEMSIDKDVSLFLMQVLEDNAKQYERTSYRNQGRILYDAILDPKRRL